MKEFAYKDDDEDFFRLKEMQDFYVFQRSFLPLVSELPTDRPEETIPPTEQYDQILEAFNEKNVPRMKECLKDFATYLYKNGFDDAEEIDRRNIIPTLIEVCKTPNEAAPYAFHVLSLLQTKGPVFPSCLSSQDFVHFCFSFVNEKMDPLMLYYALTCLMNFCSLGPDETTEIKNLIPVPHLELIYRSKQHPLVRETVLDLGWRYTYIELTDDERVILVKLSQVAIMEAVEGYYHSAFWILVKVLRHHGYMTNLVMMPEMLKNVALVMKCKKGNGLIPGMIFISYVYELGLELPELPAKKLIRRLEDATDRRVQRQACRTLIKIVKKSPEHIPLLLNKGLYASILTGMEDANYNDKIELGLLACFTIEEGGYEAVARVYVTRCIYLWLKLLEFEEDELTVEAIRAMSMIFSRIQEMSLHLQLALIDRFDDCGGFQALSLASQNENDFVAEPAAEFCRNYSHCQELVRHRYEEEEEELERKREEQEDMERAKEREMQEEE